jgi:hypothetical protein
MVADAYCPSPPTIDANRPALPLARPLARFSDTRGVRCQGKPRNLPRACPKAKSGQVSSKKYHPSI